MTGYPERLPKESSVVRKKYPEFIKEVRVVRREYTVEGRVFDREYSVKPYRKRGTDNSCNADEVLG